MTGMSDDADPLGPADFLRKMARDPRHRRRFEKLLLLACRRGDADLVKERLSWGIDPNCTFRGGKTPLIASVRGSCPSFAAVKSLLAAGADPRAADDVGLTALDHARRKLARLELKAERTRKKKRPSPSLDENHQLQLSPDELAELDPWRLEIVQELGQDAARDFFRTYWRERTRAARRTFDDADEVARIVALLETATAAGPDESLPR